MGKYQGGKITERMLEKYTECMREVSRVAPPLECQKNLMPIWDNHKISPQCWGYLRKLGAVRRLYGCKYEWSWPGDLRDLAEKVILAQRQRVRDQAARAKVKPREPRNIVEFMRVHYGEKMRW